MRHLLIISMLLTGCVTATPFELGEETEPPFGCVEARQRGIDC